MKLLQQRQKAEDGEITVEEVDVVLRGLDPFLNRAMIDWWLDIRNSLTSGGNSGKN